MPATEAWETKTCLLLSFSKVFNFRVGRRREGKGLGRTNPRTGLLWFVPPAGGIIGNVNVEKSPGREMMPFFGFGATIRDSVMTIAYYAMAGRLMRQGDRGQS